jgi:hypothetical protein
MAMPLPLTQVMFLAVMEWLRGLIATQSVVAALVEEGFVIAGVHCVCGCGGDLPLSRHCPKLEPHPIKYPPVHTIGLMAYNENRMQIWCVKL